jgi:hypothetical protein
MEGNIEIKIIADASQALKTINQVSDSLNSLRKVTTTEFSKPIQMPQIDTKSIDTSMDRISQAQVAMDQAMAQGFDKVSIKFDKSGKMITNFGKSLRRVQKIKIEPLQEVFTGKRESAIVDSLLGINKGLSEFEAIQKRLATYPIMGQGLDQGAGQLVKSIDTSIGSISGLDEKLKIVGMTKNQFLKSMQELNWAFGKNGTIVDRVTGQTMSYGQAVKIASLNAKRFKMEFLSILFLGMSMQRVFGGLIRSQMQLFGISELMGAAWTVVLLPIMELLVPILTTLISAFMELPEPVKLAIGSFVVLGAILGTLLSFFGQLFLGAQGLLMIFPGLAKLGGFFTAMKTAIIGSGGITGAIKAAGIALSGFGALALGIFAAIVAVIIGMYVAWKNNFLGMRDVVNGVLEGVKMQFQAVFTILKGIFQFFIALVKGDFGGMMDALKNIWVGIWNFIKGFFQMTISSITAILIGLIQIFKLVFWDWPKNIITSFLEWVKNVPNMIVGFFSGIGEKIAKAFTNMLPDWLLKLLGKGKVDVSVDKNGILGSRQSGGYIPQTGPYMLHQGEFVVSKKDLGGMGNQTFAPAITVNLQGGSNVNEDVLVRRISEELNRAWSYKMDRSIAR